MDCPTDRQGIVSLSILGLLPHPKLLLFPVISALLFQPIFRVIFLPSYGFLQEKNSADLVSSFLSALVKRHKAPVEEEDEEAELAKLQKEMAM